LGAAARKRRTPPPTRKALANDVPLEIDGACCFNFKAR
jgi:hypothetical protein